MPCFMIVFKIYKHVIEKKINDDNVLSNYDVQGDKLYAANRMLVMCDKSTSHKS